MSLTQAEPVLLDRKTQILDAAIRCFARRGFHLTSMHDISAEAGISVGLIYRYFANKEAVISAMADRHKQEIADVLENRDELDARTNPLTPPPGAIVIDTGVLDADATLRTAIAVIREQAPELLP